MYRRKTYGRGISSRTRKILIGVTAAALAGGAFAISTGVSGASETNAACAGFNQSMRETLGFMAEQRARPNAQTEAVLANRQAVVDLLNLQLKQAGCGVGAAPPAAAPTKAQVKAPSKAPTKAPAATAPVGGSGAGEVVCQGSTVTLSGEAGSAAASSGTFPIGTTLKVTNLDNNKSITVQVTGASGSCALLNNAAFEQVREPGKFLIRRAVIERVG
ncbi:hypothetical protein ACWKSP_21300 [Micromonosporaceae bacterium Da 78-11]